MTGRKKIALLVDYDNFNVEKYFKILFEELDEIGDLVVRRVYFSNEEGKKLAEKFRKLGLDPVYQLRFSTGKNAVDIRMAVEAMELISKDYIDTFAIATHDSDFTPLVNKLKEHNKHLIGAGRDNVSNYFKDACDVFINVQKISEAKNSTETKNNEIDVLVKLINNIIDQFSEGNEYVNLSRVVDQLKLKDKQFNPKNYGASNNKALPFFQEKLNKYFVLTKDNTTWRIKKITSKNSNKRKEKAIFILNKFYNENNPAIIQKLKNELSREIKGFTYNSIGEKGMKSFLTNNGYNIKDNIIIKK